MTTSITLNAIPITSANFARYGWVASSENLRRANTRPINGGTSLRLDECGELSLTAQGGQACLALFRASARDLTQPCTLLERHRLGTQTFIPMGGVRYVMLVATGDNDPSLESLTAFLVSGSQTVTLRADVWHHGLLSLDEGDFMIVERKSEPPDCEFASLKQPIYLRIASL